MNGRSGIVGGFVDRRPPRRGYASVAMALIMLTLAGCRSAAPPQARRVDPYRPIVPDREYAVGVTSVGTPIPDATTQAVATTETGDVSDGTQTTDTSPPSLETPERAGVRLRVIQPGDRLEVYLHGIPQPQQLPVVVDENGFMTMPMIGQVDVSGKTGSEVERLIERRYIDEGYFRSITCVVIPPNIQFFVRGEVKQPGRYPLTRDVTLMQAIALAGGYTEYAQPKRINVLRGASSFRVNAQRIERGEDQSPPIEPGDIIVVPRRWW